MFTGDALTLSDLVFVGKTRAQIFFLEALKWQLLAFKLIAITQNAHSSIVFMVHLSVCMIVGCH